MVRSDCTVRVMRFSKSAPDRRGRIIAGNPASQIIRLRARKFRSGVVAAFAHQRFENEPPAGTQAEERRLVYTSRYPGSLKWKSRIVRGEGVPVCASAA